MTERIRNILLGGLVMLVLAVVAAVFSGWPAWQSLPDDHALIRLSFAVSGARNCRDRTAEELAALPRNMRQPQVCDRRRAPVQVAMELDGTTVLDAELPPGGLSGSGPSRIYRRFEVPAGEHEIAVKLTTDPAAQDIVTERRRVTLEPGQNLAIDFDSTERRFDFQ